jgi:hypothetical protein
MVPPSRGCDPREVPMGRSHASLPLILNEETIGTHSTEKQTGGMSRAQRAPYEHRITPMGGLVRPHKTRGSNYQF